MGDYECELSLGLEAEEPNVKCNVVCGRALLTPFAPRMSKGERGSRRQGYALVIFCLCSCVRAARNFSSCSLLKDVLRMVPSYREKLVISLS